MCPTEMHHTAHEAFWEIFIPQLIEKAVWDRKLLKVGCKVYKGVLRDTLNILNGLILKLTNIPTSFEEKGDIDRVVPHGWQAMCN